MAVLGIPNYVQSKFFHKGFSKSARSIREAVEAGKLTDDAAKGAYKALAGDIAQGVASEGLWEENMQTSVQQYWSNWAKGLHPDASSSLLNGYFSNALRNAKGFAKTFTPFTGQPEAGSAEDEGAMAITLGAMLGAGMGSVSSMNSRSAERKFTQAQKEI